MTTHADKQADLPQALSRRHVLRWALGAAAAAAGSSVWARDYRPVRCKVRAIYEGAPMHVALEPVMLPPVPDGPLPTPVVARLDAAFDRILAYTSAPALTAAVAQPGVGLWQRNAVPTDAPRLFWASVGKSFTAVVVLQLALEQKLSLADPVARWVAGVPNGDAVTVRDLLAHTGGIFSSNEDAVVRANPRYRDPATMLAIARRHGAMFCPGSNWRYSNTGYDVLGEIVHKVDGRPINEAIMARIVRPLGLTSMEALKPGGPASAVAPLTSAKPLLIEPSWAGAAGPMVSDAIDMVRFWAALLGGRILSPSTVREMTANLYPMFDPGTFYGLGIMLFEVPDGSRTLNWVGHAGGVPGASAIAAYSHADNAIIAVALTGDGQATSGANLLLKSLAPPIL